MILLAGPWVGELGWELLCWQGHIRRLSRKFEKTIVIGRPGHGFLYEDFCDQYIEFDPGSYKTNGWRCEGNKCKLYKTIKHDKYISGQFDIGVFYDGKVFNDQKGLFKKQEFYKYELNDGSNYPVVIHARNKSTGAVRNWGFKKWEELVFRLKEAKINVLTIGSPESHSFKGVDDYRGRSLRDVAGVINACDIIVGPSSGPMHLASLCGKKHLVWSTNFNRLRYEKAWNPFNTPVIFYDGGGWDPSVKAIFNLIIETI